MKLAANFFFATAVVIALGFHNLAIALDESSTISEDGKRLISQIEKEFSLQLSPKSQKKIYDVFSFALTSGWYSYWLGSNDFSAASKQVKTSENRLMDFLLVSGERVFNFTFHYFPRAKQIVFYRKDIRIGSSDLGLKTFNEAKTESDTITKKETDQYAVLQRKGYIDFDIFMIRPPNAVAVYWDGGVIDL